MNSLTQKINELIKLYLKSGRFKFNKKDIGGYDELVVNRIIIESNDTLKLNIHSEIFNSVLLQFIEKEQKSKLPNNIHDAFKFIDDFDESKRNENNIKIRNAYEDIVKGQKIYILKKFKAENIAKPKEFLFELKDFDSREPHLYNFERIFFLYLPHSEYSTNEIADICITAWDIQQANSSVISFLRDYANINKDNANKLLNFLNEKNAPVRIISQLLISLYNASDVEALNKAIALKESSPLESFIALGRLDYRNVKDIEQAFNTIEPLDYSDKDISSEQAYFSTQLIEHSNTPKEIKEECFKYLVDIIEQGTDEIANNVFNHITYSLNEYEDEKYNLLWVYIAKTKNINVLKHFFYYFKDPKYIFHFIIQHYKLKPSYQFPIHNFRDGLHHAWQNSQEKTEDLILNLFKYNLTWAVLGVKIILSQGLEIYRINFLKLKEKEHQINAIHSLCANPFAIDKLLPVLLPLRKSKHVKVIETLQSELAHRVFNSYYETLYELIKKELSENKEDKDFLKPITEALEKYYELKELKASIKDLDPIENEKDLMELYYRLEREEQAKSMKNIDKGEGAFLQFFGKSVVIVKGNSSKIGDGRIFPLATIQLSMLVDRNAYINPDLFEHNLNIL
jgi:hypothetical protein